MSLNKCECCKGDAEWFMQDKTRIGLRFYHFGERVPIGPYKIVCDKCKRDTEAKRFAWWLYWEDDNEPAEWEELEFGSCGCAANEGE